MDEKETSRLEAFSDGVFAVAITLLILNIQVPHDIALDKDLFGPLLGQLPALLAFITSFATIGIMWINHHRLFTHIKRVDNNLLILNLLLLLIIVFIPVPTALLAVYITSSAQHTAALIYTGTNVFLAIGFSLLWRYAAHENRLLDKNADRHAVRTITNQYRFGPLLYLITFALAWVNTPVSVVMSLLLALFFALPGRKKPGAGADVTPSLEERQASSL